MEIYNEDISKTLQLLLLSPENDLSELQKVLDGAPRNSLNISGQLQSSTASEEIFIALPEGFDITKKFVIGRKFI
jgi:hypothetical protein